MPPSLEHVSVVHLTTVHHPYDPRIFYRELATLREGGLDVHLVAQHEGDAVVEGVPVHALAPVTARHGWGHRLRRLALQRQAADRVRRIHPDIIHIHDPELIPLAFWLKQRTKVAVVYDMHEDYRWHGDVAGRGLRAVERWCFRWVDHVVVANPGHRGIVSDGTPATVLPNYTRLPDALLAPVPPTLPGQGEPFRLIYAGFQGRSRGLMTMIELARAIREADLPWRIDLVGACRIESDRVEAEALIQQYRVDTIVQRIGWDRIVPWPTLLQHYRRAHVGLFLAMPHRAYFETHPTKFFEYLRFGLPILCTDLSAWRPFISHHRCGAVVVHGDVRAALQQLRQWASDAARYQMLTGAAWRAGQHYRWERVAPRLVQVYRDVLKH
ncbi:MAG: glycosyltransferase [Bacteroidetes bacterium]|nr:glycosyltransferase [Bacteroidota bacterium]